MIFCLYGAKFIRKLKVEYNDELMQLKLYLHDNMNHPLVISIQTDDKDKFLDYINKELKQRTLTWYADWAKVKLVDGNK